MNSIFRKIAVLSVCAVLSVSCSSSDGGSKKSDDKSGQDGAPTPEKTSAGDLATLPMTRWCANGVSENQNVQHRFHFQDNQSVEYTIFGLNADDQRGDVLGQATGRWQVINTNDLVVEFGGEKQTFKIYVQTSDESPTHAPQLLLGASGEKMEAFDPCE